MDAIIIAAVAIVEPTAILEIHMKVARHVQHFVVGRTVARVTV
jgi:hypothetical protein